MASQPQNTGIPYIINQNLFNTLDFLTAAANLNSLVQTFPNEICVSYLYNFTKTTNDPITSQAIFFKEINKNLLKLKNNFKCSKNPYVKQYNFIKDNLEFDQLIWEHGDILNPAWVHVSYFEGKNRKQILKAIKINNVTAYLKWK